ncbi:hypothetical protein EMIHUDRAFT_219795 [Emiliania huxleyi CCMP1516]|uniref:EamA domain-containing protein n=2 Tax=Emiliania huxleyi TaxID=2903 RepID=A0A0D3I3A9_EMIH1|nr:hypothetical protein EMIHUDRAFT_219795 [Emiliania huxleyi CCMP1516]EOD05744.1 hypothetical protein EMIHUDRAFT_219795 [Emiliania huxleyi CCMP1516]|eukprot:XP_005758173.1 hypothetical protein EMIHUDRAFT_219795 [Emiliania huxleyi CCMP1516]
MLEETPMQTRALGCCHSPDAEAVAVKASAPVRVEDLGVRARVLPRALPRLILYAGVTCVTPDALLLRLQREEADDMLTILLWRTVFVCVMLTPVAASLRGGFAKLFAGLAAAPPVQVLAAGALQALATVTFGASLMVCDPAQALILTSLAPLWAALLGALLFDEPVSGRTLGALALALTSFMAGYIVATRRLAHSHPRACGPAIPALGAYLALLVLGAAKLATEGARGLVPPSGTFVALSALNAFGISAMHIAIALVSGRVPPTEVAIALLLEVPLGPLWMVAGVGEPLSAFTMSGGALLIATIAGKELLDAHWPREAFEQFDVEGAVACKIPPFPDTRTSPDAPHASISDPSPRVRNSSFGRIPSITDLMNMVR